MPQMSPLSWITTLLLLFSFLLMTKSLMKMGKLLHTPETQNQIKKSQLKWKW